MAGCLYLYKDIRLQLTQIALLSLDTSAGVWFAPGRTTRATRGIHQTSSVVWSIRFVADHVSWYSASTLEKLEDGDPGH